jgi:Asp-tRNA(Asn)/Glu-tRNA(Gln) amidotransferase A subunit family amidase
VKKLRRSRASFAAATLGAAVLTVSTTGAASSAEPEPAAGTGLYLAPYHTEGDLTGDSRIDTDDLDLLVAAMGTTDEESGWAAVSDADYDGDGEIAMTDVADLSQRMIYDDGPFELVEASALDMQAAMNAGVTTSVELTQDYLDRIAAYDAKTFAATGTRALNSIVTTGGAKALAAAAASDAARATNGGPSSMLDGIPILLKDNYDTSDLPTSAGTGGWKNNQTADDAFMVAGLREAGAVILGKASLDEFALGFASEFSTNSAAGQSLLVASPYDLSRTAGGSSGGTGASIAANLGAIGFGTDTGGSIRVPSSYNQLVGIRPTVGLTSRDGIVPLALSQDTGGPIARSVSDAAIALDAVTGVDPNDEITSEQVGHVPASYTSFLDDTALAGKRIGFFTNMVSTNATTVRLFNQAKLDLQAQGATVVDLGASPAAINATLSEPSGSTNEFKHDLNVYVENHLDPTVAQRDLTSLLAGGQMVPNRSGTYVGRNNVTQEQYDTWMGTHLAAIANGEAAVEEVLDTNDLDAIMYPSGTPYGTFSTNMRLSPNTGMPSVTVPMGQSIAADAVAQGVGAGVNLELLGRNYSEGTLLGLAYDYEQATHHRTTPALFPALEGTR